MHHYRCFLLQFSFQRHSSFLYQPSGCVWHTKASTRFECQKFLMACSEKESKYFMHSGKPRNDNNLKSTLSHSNSPQEIHAMRIDYAASTIEDDNIPSKNPFRWFDMWFEEATKHPGVQEPNAMNLATATKSGKVSARIVLLKSVSSKGYGFYTNHESEKGIQLAENPYAALTFFWEPLQKQIRIGGPVWRMSEEESTTYFHSRPIGSQIGAWVSRQTSVIPDSKYLTTKNEEFTERYEGNVVPKPPYWGGYVVVPETFEFWCGRSSRLHDRIRFRRPEADGSIDSSLTKYGSDGWLYERLSP